MRLRLLSFGRPYKARRPVEPRKPHGFHPEDKDNCHPKKVERQGFVSCRSIVINAWIRLSYGDPAISCRTYF
jgi:hypothetical protein